MFIVPIQKYNNRYVLIPQAEHGQALERLEASRVEEINILTDAQRELERRLAEKTSQCRRVEDEAVALKDKLLQSADARAQWLTKKVASLEKEVESLNAVLEIKVIYYAVCAYY